MCRKKKKSKGKKESKTAERKIQGKKKKETEKKNEIKNTKNPPTTISKKMSYELTAQCFATSVTAIACEYGPPTEGCKCCTQTWTLS